MVKVIIDTSAWIDFFRNSTGEIGDTVAELIKADLVVMTGPVLAELLQGMKNKKQAKMLDDLLNILPFEETSRADWEDTGTLLRTLREKGITTPLTDALIAVVAGRGGYGVLTQDKHFEHLDIKNFNS